MKKVKMTHRSEMRPVKTEKRADKGLKMKGENFKKSKAK